MPCTARHCLRARREGAVAAAADGGADEDVVVDVVGGACACACMGARMGGHAIDTLPRWLVRDRRVRVR